MSNKYIVTFNLEDSDMASSLKICLKADSVSKNATLKYVFLSYKEESQL
jgi:hypothetical protein